MIDISKCKNTAKLLAEQSKKILGDEKLNNFSEGFDKIVNEYKSKYIFHSTAIELQKLKSFHQLISSILEDKDLLTPIIADKMVNNKDLYYLSLYQNLYTGTNLVPNMNGCESDYIENGGGESALALITSCYWITHSNDLE
jgi:hypothetical protein